MTKSAAVAYFHTSSAANTGPDKDSKRRQRAAVTAYAKAVKLEVAAEFYNAAVSGCHRAFACPRSPAAPTWTVKTDGGG
jgi:hypothetical protein